MSKLFTVDAAAKIVVLNKCTLKTSQEGNYALLSKRRIYYDRASLQRRLDLWQVDLPIEEALFYAILHELGHILQQERLIVGLTEKDTIYLKELDAWERAFNLILEHFWVAPSEEFWKLKEAALASHRKLMWG